ncbi:MAG TPA: flavin reductase family protein [Rhodocyclaceae bacterium]|jgi:flavin reductase (DIM6/NTAB) family NADH-FMN oxidoreductase RutF|nr:flavin reductase family protein [Rhodocyclaceae bacterium]
MSNDNRPDLSQNPDLAGLRYALSSFATGVTVVTTRDANGQQHGLTANSFASVSLDPPLVLWSISRGTPSFEAFRGCSHYAVNILSSDQEEISNRFAHASPDKFAGLEYTLGVGGSPVLAGCIASFECRNETQHDGGDHVILVGRVQNFKVDMGTPLLFFASRYASLLP